MHDKLRQRVKGAEHDVVCDPNKEKPARPVVTTEHKHSAKNREHPDEASPDDVIFKGTLDVELGGMVGNSDDTDYNEHATNDGDREWTSIHGVQLVPQPRCRLAITA